MSKHTSVLSLFWTSLVIACCCFYLPAKLAAQGVLTLQVGSPPPPPTLLVNHGDMWRYRKGTNSPGVGLWQTNADANLDSTWLSGLGGLGYADNVTETQDCRTVIADMRNLYTTLYFRRSFPIVSPVDPAMHLQFTIDYDDGFVAYLDGAEITRGNAPGSVGTEPAFNAVTPGLHESSHGNSPPLFPPEVHDLGAVGSRLGVGTHVLAILGINQALTSSDLIMVSDLALVGGSGGTASGGPFLAIVRTNATVLSGSNTISGSTRVTINGDDATLSSGAWSKTQSLGPGVNKLFIAALNDTGAILASTNYIVVSETNTTSVGGTLTGNTIWSSAMGNIHVTSTVVVPPGASLTIQPGTVLLFSAGANILATNATISALGTADAPIYFLPLDGSTVWGEVAISGTSGNLLMQHVETIAGHVEVFDGAVGTLEDSYFHDYQVSSPAIIHTLGQPNHVTLNLRRCHVSHYYEILSQVATNHIEDCLCEWQADGGDGIDFDDAQPGSYIRRCTVRFGRFTNIDALDMGELNGDANLGSRGVLIDSCLLHDMVDKGVSLGIAVDVTVTNTLIYNVDTGIAVKDNSIAGIYNNTIADSAYGYRCYNKANGAATDGGGFITNSFNNLLWHFTNATYSLLNGSTMIADDTDFYATNYPGTGNFTSDPLFINSAIHDYRVAGNSPTLGAGLGGANIGVTFPVGGIPAVPLNLAAISSGANPVNLVFVDDADNETGVIVERSTDAATWTTLTTLAANATSYADNSALLGQKYYYRVRATNTSGDSLNSNPASGIRQTPTVNVGGTISSDTIWASGSHFVVTSAVTVASSATLTIQAGVTVCFNSGISMTVANGGRLLASGTSNAPILFTRAGASGNWGNLTINGAVGSPESRITWARFEFNATSPCIQVSAGTVFFDHLTFGNPGAAYIHVDGASFVIQNCEFPTPTAGFEPCHGTGGIKSGGHGIFLRNFFGAPNGYNDVVDFTGGNRPGQPIVHFINNVLMGSADDGWDLDGTDAWVEKNIFLHMHKNGSPDTSSGISGGDDSGNTSEITIIGNLFFDCDQAAMAKQGNFFTLFNNTILHQTHVGGLDTTGAVVCLEDGGVAEGAGMYLEGNIMEDIETFTRNVTAAIVTFTNNIVPIPWTGLGGGNLVADPLFKHIPQVSETLFTNWAQAQVMWDWLSLQTNSPAIEVGPNRTDAGAVTPIGASISGEPSGTTTNNSATLHIGINRAGSAIPAAGWPNGSGYVAYKWRLNGGAWSAETPINTPITLTNLSDGAHFVEVSGKRDSGLYQDDPLFGDDAVLTRSRTWIVAPRIEAISLSGPNSVHIQFTARPNNGYVIQYRDSLFTGAWMPLIVLDPTPTGGPVDYTDTVPAATTMRFYRLGVP